MEAPQQLQPMTGGRSSRTSSAISASPLCYQLLWEGAVPVEFNMDPREVTAFSPPPPFYAMVPRMGYLPLAAVEAVTFFRTFTASVGPRQSLWFETQDEMQRPLKWHIPAGPLFDLYGDPNQLPWKVTIHFQGCPDRVVSDYEGPKSAEAYFMNSMKQASYLQHGKGSQAFSLAKADHEALWDAIVSNNRNKHMTVIERSGLSTPMRPKLVPVRLLMEDHPQVQPRVTPTNASGELVTLHEVLEQATPEALEESGSGSGSSTGSGSVVSCQGVTVPLWAPIVELWEALHHPDFYLYITLRRRQPTQPGPGYYDGGGGIPIS